MGAQPDHRRRPASRMVGHVGATPRFARTFTVRGCREPPCAVIGWEGASVATLFGVLTILVLVLVPGYLIWMLFKTIQDERRSQHLRRVWANFSLSLILCILFFVSWGGQAVSQWREFVQDQREHNQPAEAGEFFVDFGASTLENWQSEFLQLFSFVVLAAAFIHRGSSESRDSDDRMEQMLKEIKAKIGA